MSIISAKSGLVWHAKPISRVPPDPNLVFDGIRPDLSHSGRPGGPVILAQTGSEMVALSVSLKVETLVQTRCSLRLTR